MLPADDPWNRFVSRAVGDLPSKDGEAGLYALFFYGSEVNNGGHLQFFLNMPVTEDWDLVAEAARTLRQEDVAANFERARHRWEERNRTEPNSVKEYVEQALEGEFDVCDAKFYELEPELNAAFERAVADSEEG